MYIQITDRCNMSCEHCCMSATSKGRDMSEKVFRAACQQDDLITIGGGEPTLHPQFWKFLAIALAYGTEGVWMATNGSQTETSLVLAKMAKKGILGVALSIDSYHRDIEPEVVEAFTDGHDPYEWSIRRWASMNRNSEDRREIRSVDKIMATGRGKNIPGALNECPCEETIVQPSGRMVWCGCDDAPYVGHVLKDGLKSSRQDFDSHTCFKQCRPELAEEVPNEF